MEMCKGKHPHSHSRWLVLIHSVSMCSYARVTERIAQTLLCNVWSQSVIVISLILCICPCLGASSVDTAPPKWNEKLGKQYGIVTSSVCVNYDYSL